LVDDDHRSRAVQGFFIILRMIDKHDVAMFNLVNFVDAGDNEIGIAIKRAMRERSNLLKRLRRR